MFCCVLHTHPCVVHAQQRWRHHASCFFHGSRSLCCWRKSFLFFFLSFIFFVMQQCMARFGRKGEREESPSRNMTNRSFHSCFKREKKLCTVTLREIHSRFRTHDFGFRTKTKLRCLRDQRDECIKGTHARAPHPCVNDQRVGNQQK